MFETEDACRPIIWWLSRAALSIFPGWGTQYTWELVFYGTTVPCAHGTATTPQDALQQAKTALQNQAGDIAQ